MYDIRKKLEKGKSPAQMVIKLLMNSMYGTTITEPVKTDTIIKDTR